MPALGMNCGVVQLLSFNQFYIFFYVLVDSTTTTTLAHTNLHTSIHAQLLCLCQRELFKTLYLSLLIVCIEKQSTSTTIILRRMKTKIQMKSTQEKEQMVSEEWRFSVKRKCIVCTRNEKRFCKKFRKSKLLFVGIQKEESVLMVNKRDGQIMWYQQRRKKTWSN